MKVITIPRTYDDHRYTLEPEERDTILKIARDAEPEGFTEEDGTRLVVTRIIVGVERVSTKSRTPVSGNGATWEEWSRVGQNEVQIYLDTQPEILVPGTRKAYG